MKKDDEIIKELLGEIAALLRCNGECAWATAFRDLETDYDKNPQVVRGKVRSLYGGMGSFNDMILHSDSRKPLAASNDRLDDLRSRLYEMCRSVDSTIG